ncbi:MAG TPA: D-aminoacylase [Dehalococcoidia bacterium]|nr:D-aminoacylase [Dehalococcoidia bacterium]
MQANEPIDLVIRGGTVYDGSGAPGVAADVAVRGDRIAGVGVVRERAANELDASGLAVSPGFIDVHAHDDMAVLLDPDFACKVLQGVTSDIVGNCGVGVAPFPAAIAAWRDFAPGAQPVPWDGFGGYLRRLDEQPPSLNVAVLMGQGTIRRSVMGVENRPATAAEVARMQELVREGRDAGCVGLSTGLIYEPGRYTPTEEIIALARELGTGGGLYATHMRNEAAGLLDSVREAIRIGEEAGVPVQISHHKVSGAENAGKVRESIALIEAARARGLDVTADQYPYTAGSTAFFAVVQNGNFRKDGDPEAGGIGRVRAEDVLFAAAPKHPEWEGQTLAQIAEQMDLPVEDAAARILEEEGQSAFVVLFMMDEADVRTVMTHPTTMIGSDGVPAGKKPHPRLFGCFARVLGRYTRDEGVLDLATAIHKMTGMPARKFKLAGRGSLAPGSFADLVVFDPRTIADTATYEEPRRHPTGIRAVYVNGVCVARDGEHTHARPGRALRRGA